MSSGPSETAPEPQVAVDTTLTTKSLPQDLLLLVFIHGFKGTDSTFGQFPDRLRHILSETIRSVVVESVVFPAYETKGELNAAVIRFADWLTNLTVQREVANGVGGGAGKAKIVLCGHSMGGILAADALIEFVRTRPDPKAPLWPNIIGCLAFDTPYFGLHPHVFKNSATQAAGYVRSAQNMFSSISSFGAKAQAPAVSQTHAAITAPPAAAQAQTSIWQKFAPAAYAVGGALIAGAAAGTAYYKREDIGVGYTWAADHMKYVGTLWDEAALRRRVETLLKIEENMGVIFRTFYTCLPPNPPTFPSPRTFIILPQAVYSSPRYGSHFLLAPNSLASDEIQAHTGIFNGKTNDGYYELGLLAAQLIRDVVTFMRNREELQDDLEPKLAGTDSITKKPASSPTVSPETPAQTTAEADGPAVENTEHSELLL